MDLTKQPPRRPSNTCIAGIINLARMADKARASNADTLGEYVYGKDSGLDQQLLDFLGISHEDFADAARRYDDDTIGKWVLEVSGKTDSEIEAFNRELVAREPGDPEGRKRLEDRVARYAPGSTDIKTGFQSIELEDWGLFREVDLTVRAPRSPYCRDVAGIFGVARMAEKARAAVADSLGEYIYNCPIDQAILGFLGIPDDDFRDAAYKNPNDLELGAWVTERTSRKHEEISWFNHRLANRRPETDEQRAYFEETRDKVAPGRTEITTWFDLIDVDDEFSFGTIDLTRHPPRSAYDAGVGGIVGLARMIDKGRASLKDTLGEYWYGLDSGIDRDYVLPFLGVSAEEFREALRTCPADADILAWLEQRGRKSEAETAEYNQATCNLVPKNEAGWTWFRGYRATYDPSRDDVVTYFALMQLEDVIGWARFKAGV